MNSNLFVIGFLLAARFSLLPENLTYQCSLDNNLDSLMIEIKTSGSDLRDKQSKLESYYVQLNGTLFYEAEDVFDEHVDDAVDLFNDIIVSTPECSDALTILSGIYGLKIAYTPMLGMFYGLKAGSYMRQAVDLDLTSRKVILLRGINQYIIPAAFGGITPVAIQTLEALRNRLVTNQDASYNWKYLHALAWQGIACEELSQIDKARDCYLKALKLEPKFKWAEFLL